MTLRQGTVTFFFSDIEGSTRLVQRLGPEYPAALGLHAAIIRSVLAGCDATEIRTEGDSFFVVFSSAAEAVRAACAIQEGMAAAEWPETGAVRVRIGLHTGEASPGGDDYVGIDVHRAARIGDAGHGGQVVTSATTRDLAVSAGLEVPFRDLGRHRLRGIDDPTRLYQVDVPGLPVAFPPLRTEASRPNNLPAAASSLVGREQETAAIMAALAESRVVTLVGPGGVGKTRLALQVAGEALPRHDDGVFLVELAPLTDPSLVPATIASVLGVREVDALAEHLAPRDLLLVVDNFEHLPEAAPAISQLVAAAPRVRFLATSQVPLRISGERVVPVTPLAADGPGLRLFHERALAADPSYRPDDDPEAIRLLVEALGGLPLALELAAARVALLPPRAILERIGSGYDIGITRSDAPGRHRSLSAAIAWSYDLLPVADRAALARLSVFHGGAGFEAAEEVIAGDPVADAFASLAELVDRSLVVRDLTGVSSVRLVLLDPVRRFAAERLLESGLADSVAERHAAHFCRLAEEASTGLMGDRVSLWLSRLEEELDNLRAVLERSIAAGDAERALGLLGATWRFFQSRGHLAELELWLDRAFALPGGEPAPARVKGLMARGAYEYWRSNPAGAVATYRAAVEMARGLGDRKLLGEALYGGATSAIMSSDTVTGRALLAEATAIFVATQDHGMLADAKAAEGFAELTDHDLTAAAPLLEEAGVLYEAAGRRINAAQTRIARSAVAIDQGRFEDARDRALEALDMGEGLGDLFLMVWALEYLARIEIDLGRVAEGAALAGACEAARSWLGGGWSPVIVGLEDAATRAAALLGPGEAAAAIDRGRGLDLDEAVRLARHQTVLV